jgi:hypothetical protein
MELNLLYALVGCSEGKKTPITPYTATWFRMKLSSLFLAPNKQKHNRCLLNCLSDQGESESLRTLKFFITK